MRRVERTKFGAVEIFIVVAGMHPLAVILIYSMYNIISKCAWKKKLLVASGARNALN